MSNIQANTTWRTNEQFAARQNSYAPEKSPGTDETGSFAIWEPKIELDERPDDTLGRDEDELVSPLQSDAEKPVADNVEITPTQLEEKLKENYELGFAEGKKQTEDGFQSHRKQLLDLIEGFREAQSDLSSYYSPLVKLAITMAEQLVRAELSFSHAAIEGLVKKVLAEIEALAEGPVTVWMNPEDIEMARNVLQKEYAHISFEPDVGLSRASVRAVMDDTAIEDVRENRLEHLVKDMLLQKQTLEDGNSTSIADDTRETDAEAAIIEVSGNEKD